MNNESNNSQLQKQISRFADLSRQIAGLENNFSRDHMNEYSEMVERQSQLAANIIKSGADYSITEDHDYIVFDIDGTQVNVKVEDVVKHQSVTEIQLMFQRQIDKDKQKEREERHKKKEEARRLEQQRQNEENPYLAAVHTLLQPFFENGMFDKMAPAIEQKETSLLDDLAKIQNKAIELQMNLERSNIDFEDQLKKKADEICGLEAQLSKASAERKDVIQASEALKTENRELQQKAVMYDQKISELEENIKESEQKIAELERNIAATQEELDIANATLEELQESGAANEEELKVCDELRAQLADMREANESLMQKVLAYESAADERASGLADDERQGYEQQIQELSVTLQQLQNDSESSDQLKEQLEYYKHIAYYDEQYGVKNANAFRDELNTYEKDAHTVVVCGICGMKIFNNAFGRKKGDEAIKMVADALCENFNDETNSIYRIYGDQFVVIVNSEGVSVIKDKLSRIQNNLSAKLVEIVYGCVDGVIANNMEDAYKRAEADMKQMQIRSGKNEILHSKMEKILQNMGENSARQYDDSDREEYADDDVTVMTKTAIEEEGESEVWQDSSSDDGFDYDDMYNAINAGDDDDDE